MTNNHLKRIKAPRTWQIFRKAYKFISRPNPGGHSYELAVSLNTFLKELAGVSQTTKDTKYLLTHKGVEVNGKRKRDETDGMFLIQKFLDAYISSYTYIISDYRFINEYQELNKRLRKKVYPIYIERVREDGSIIEPVIEDEIREYGKIRDEAIIWQIPWYEDRGSIMGGHWKDELKKDVYSYLDYLLSPSCDETHT